MFNPYVPRPIDLPATVPLDPAADLSVLDEAKIFAAPSDPGDWPAWRQQLARWRTEARERVGYDGARYDTERTDTFVVGLVWFWDELLYDHETGRFTVDVYLDTAERDFGGFDGVVLWHAYPNEGIDGRDQFDFYTDVPELPDVVAAFQARGVRVFAAYYPWEESEPERLAQVVKWVGADGVFLDSSKEGSREVRTMLDELSPGLSMEGESRLPLARIHDHSMSWAQWFADSPVPGVLRATWFERRHMLHHTRRWNHSHLEELHSAWLNGSGMLVWENVFGVWVGWSERDRSILRAMRRVQASHRAWLQSEHWTPLADHPGGDVPVYASRWEHDGETLWTLVNKGDHYDGPWLVTDVSADAAFSEVATGAPVQVTTDDAGRTVIGGPLPAGGIAAVVAGARTGDGANLPTTPLAGDASFPARAAIRRPAPTAPAGSVPEGMAEVPGGRYDLVVRHRVRETGLYGEIPYVDEWKPLPPRLHHTGTLHRVVRLGAVAIGRVEVTNAEYAAFVDATGYVPMRTERFLEHFAAGSPPPGREQEPVTYVDLDDARAYARWAGFRLPTEDEWQVAGESGLLERGEPAVWNLTESEHADGRTRFVILKGGAAWRADGSDWYFDGGLREPDFSAKYLRCGAGVDRSPSVGFRCAVDLPSHRADGGDHE
ncbi:formylglycine-generating enzyme family protein [Phytoactinopolyspora alkaliphila]|uniref:Formylglycine-generating enzyme family protein n=1 Tax=Phytoactinopolyspora alkaliphila TaxID=1783498 RepID=A0A6N9YQZ8_9ACTN|nr:SUMF1/EgtB/PvdO family nonheme iron enzyme [Phytoactinopolyspora alkaliphila]NED97404.1 formylglycine-generating enzyme family protein [Phytoactinopolyspora alkaliphila]